MSKPKSLYDVINGVKTAKAKRRSYKGKPVPIGHHLAVRVYRKGIYLDTLFVDNIDICKSYTMIHYNPRLMEEFPYKYENTMVSFSSTWVIYENGVDFEIIRIS